MFYDHWKDPVLKGCIEDLIALRRRVGVESNAAVYIVRATEGCYAAHVGSPKDMQEVGSSSDIDLNKPSLCMKIGPDDWSPNKTKVGDAEWKCKASGDGWAVWENAKFMEPEDGAAAAS